MQGKNLTDFAQQHDVRPYAAVYPLKKIKLIAKVQILDERPDLVEVVTDGY
jgi:hypothetical protein